MGGKMKPRQRANQKKGHGVPKKGWKSQPFNFGNWRRRNYEGKRQEIHA